MVIYLDELLVINAIIDYALLRVTAKVMGHLRNRRRMLLAAVAGAVYAVCVCLPRLTAIGHPLVRIAVGISMGITVFGWNRSCVRKTMMFFLLAATLGGIVYALSHMLGGVVGIWNGVIYADLSVPLLLAATGLTYALLSLFPSLGAGKPQTARQILTATAALSGRTSTFSVLADTGCMVADPLTSRPVIVAAPEAVAPLLPPRMLAALVGGTDPVEVIASYSGGELRLHPLFCRSVSGTETLLAAFQPTSLILDGHDHPALIAVSPRGFAGETAFSAVINAEAI